MTAARAKKKAAAKLAALLLRERAAIAAYDVALTLYQDAQQITIAPFEYGEAKRQHIKAAKRSKQLARAYTNYIKAAQAIKTYEQRQNKKSEGRISVFHPES